jgi:hypothetical protein
MSTRIVKNSPYGGGVFDWRGIILIYIRYEVEKKKVARLVINAKREKENKLCAKLFLSF